MDQCEGRPSIVIHIASSRVSGPWNVLELVQCHELEEWEFSVFWCLLAVFVYAFKSTGPQIFGIVYQLRETIILSALESRGIV